MRTVWKKCIVIEMEMTDAIGCAFMKVDMMGRGGRVSSRRPKRDQTAR